MKKVFYLFTVLIAAMLFSCKMTDDNLVEYSVIHLQQNIEDEGYTEIERETLKGSEGNLTAAKAKSYDGFTAKPFVQEKITSKKEIQIKYDRNPVTFRFNLAGGNGETSITKKYGTPVNKETVPDPELEGAVFSFWAPQLPEIFAENATYTANWNFTPYKVQYFFQHIEDDEYSEDEAYPEKEFYGKIGQLIPATGPAVPSFELKAGDGVELKEEGQVIKVYYDRKMVTLFIDLDGGSGNSFVTKKAGSAFSAELIGTVEKTGYIFDGFDRDFPSTFAVENNNKTIAKALWKGEGDARYGIKFYKQSKYSYENAYYEAPELKFRATGKTGDLTDVKYDQNLNKYIVNGAEIDITGFHPAADSRYAFENQKILGDETTVVKIYLDRNVITYTIDLNGGHIAGDNGGTSIDYAVSGRYEEFVVLPELERTGYTRAEELWENGSIPLYFPAECPPEKAHVVAKWNPNTYKIRFHNEENNELVEDSFVFDSAYTFTPSVSGITDKYFAKFKDVSGLTNSLAGWSKTPELISLDYKDGDQIIFENAADVDLYAVWNVVYRIHYDRDATPTNQTTYTSQGSIFVVAPYLYGATTDYSSYYDYYLESNGLIVFDSRKIPDVPLVRDNTGSTSLRLGWKQVTISFDLQGGTADSAEDRTYYAKYGTLNNIPTPTKEGYAFKDWTPAFTKNSSGITSWPIEDTVYVAQWEIVNYKVTYKYLNGANSSNLIKEFTMETDCDLVNPSLSGYEFDGWYKDVGFKERVTHIDSGTTQNITLLGKWKKTYTDSMCSEQIKALGDIVLSNGKVVNCGGIEGLCIEFPDEIKNKAIAVITHKYYSYDDYKYYWRGMGLRRSEDRLDWTTTPSKIKYNESGKNLDFDCYFDGKNSTDILLTMDSSAKTNQDNYPAWKYVWNYGNNYLSDATPLSGLTYTDGWYLPAASEISSNYGNPMGKEYFYYILLSLGIDLDSSDEFWTCNTYKDGNTVGNPYKNNQGEWKFYIPGDRTYMSVSTYIWSNYPSNKKCYVYAFHDFGIAE